MRVISTKNPSLLAEGALFDNWFDAIEDAVRNRVRGFHRNAARGGVVPRPRAPRAVFAGAVGKDVVSRTWLEVKGDWDAWRQRSLTDEPIVRLILDKPDRARSAR